ncbi:MAG: hypothetical protein DWQ35_00505, partial [Planctomycetota bacterium]
MARAKRSVEKESFWRSVIEEFAASGLSVRTFCGREGLSEASFYAWRRTLAARDAEKPPELIPVDVVAPSARRVAERKGVVAGDLELTTPAGFTLR